MTGVNSTSPTVGAVIITMGNRPEELRALIDSVVKQDGDPVRIAVVGNGVHLPAGVTVKAGVQVDENTTF